MCNNFCFFVSMPFMLPYTTFWHLQLGSDLACSSSYCFWPGSSSGSIAVAGVIIIWQLSFYLFDLYLSTILYCFALCLHNLHSSTVLILSINLISCMQNAQFIFSGLRKRNLKLQFTCLATFISVNIIYSIRSVCMLETVYFVFFLCTDCLFLPLLFPDTDSTWEFAVGATTLLSAK